jgi:hypothetical protein
VPLPYPTRVALVTTLPYPGRALSTTRPTLQYHVNYPGYSLPRVPGTLRALGPLYSYSSTGRAQPVCHPNGSPTGWLVRSAVRCTSIYNMLDPDMSAIQLL